MSSRELFTRRVAARATRTVVIDGQEVRLQALTFAERAEIQGLYRDERGQSTDDLATQKRQALYVARSVVDKSVIEKIRDISSCSTNPNFLTTVIFFGKYSIWLIVFSLRDSDSNSPAIINVNLKSLISNNVSSKRSNPLYSFINPKKSKTNCDESMANLFFSVLISDSHISL